MWGAQAYVNIRCRHVNVGGSIVRVKLLHELVCICGYVHVQRYMGASTYTVLVFSLHVAWFRAVVSDLACSADLYKS